MATDTRSPCPTCDNCGHDMIPTYTCDVCIDRLNDHIRSTNAKLTAVLEFLSDQVEARCYCEFEFDRPEVRLTHCDYCDIYARTKAIVEGGE